MSLTNLLIPTYTQMLNALSGWLDKAVEHSCDPEAVLNLRLAPDMLPLSSQIRFCCVQVHEAVLRLQGEPLNDVWKTLLYEGQNAGDHPGTMEQAKRRLAETVAFLAALEPHCLDAGRDRKIAIELPDDMVFDMTGEQYARDWALPQFNFHLITAYAILRNAGVPLGKADYVQHAFAYLRPGAA